MTGKRPARNDKGKTKMKTKQNTAKNTNEAFEQIAKETLGISTLTAQLADRLDFHTIGVWQLKRALQAAYDLGKASK